MSINLKWLANKKINYERVNKYLAKCEQVNQFTNQGPLIKKLESYLYKILEISDDKEVIVTNNGTSALHALASGINHYHNKSLTYATQAFTFPSSVQGPLCHSVIVDLNNDDFPLDLNNVCPLEIDGIIITNYSGNLVNINKYEQYCKLHNKILLFDNAATAFSTYNNINACNYGNGSIV